MLRNSFLLRRFSMKNLKTVDNATSIPNGIIFYSNINPNIAYTSFIDENNEIKTYTIPSFKCRFEENLFSNLISKVPSLTKFVFIYYALIGIWAFFVKNIFSFLAIIYFLIFIAKDLLLLIFSIYQMKFGYSCFKTNARFHAAEHMAINAYANLQRVPTIEEIKHEPRVTEDCGSMIIFKKIIMHSFICFAIYFIASKSIIAFALFCAISSLVLLFLFEKGYMNFLQLLVTSKPNDIEILVAYLGIKKFDRVESFLKAKNSSKSI